MSIEKKPISPLIYYSIVSTLTSVLFVSVSTLAFILTNFFNNFVIIIIAVVFLLKGPLVGLYLTAYAKRSTKETTLKVLGMYHGRIICFIAGVAIGSSLANGIGAIVGALLFYFLGRWLGPVISIGIANQIEKNFQIPEKQEAEVHSVSSKKSIFPLAYYLLLPLFFVLLAYLFKYFDIQSDIASEYLPFARMIVIALSVFSIGAPWLLKNHLKITPQTDNKNVIDLSLLGMAFSIVPVIYGFFLFMMGATILELASFAGISIISGVIWLLYLSKIEKAFD